jgi:hypothetical protein
MEYGDADPVKAKPIMKRQETGETENSDTTADDMNENKNDLANNDNKKIPSIKDLIFDFTGSIIFIIGSSGFILSLYNANWLPYFRYSCNVWIWGCLAYATPIVTNPAHVKDGKKYSCSDVGVLLCLLLYIAGCILGGFLSENRSWHGWSISTISLSLAVLHWQLNHSIKQDTFLFTVPHVRNAFPRPNSLATAVAMMLASFRSTGIASWNSWSCRIFVWLEPLVDLDPIPRPFTRECTFGKLDPSFAFSAPFTCGILDVWVYDA